MILLMLAIMIWTLKNKTQMRQDLIFMLYQILGLVLSVLYTDMKINEIEANIKTTKENKRKDIHFPV